MLTFKDKEKSILEIIDEYIPQEYHLRERIQCAMLFAAATKDIAIPTVSECILLEQAYIYPIAPDDENLIDTETIYYDAECFAKEVLTEVYGEEYIEE